MNDRNDSWLVEPVLLVLQQQIADNAVRADIECYAASVIDADGNRLFNLHQPLEEGVDMQIVHQAATYIELRGDVFPWQMKRRIDAPNLVQFVEKETQ
ncbi:MAG: hypothetical protein ACREP4_06530 [Stenotrophomonas sp.]|uniref:hypothetical protein n=1 Tax=Stenotrophomonas sp. TaxID=69392 RepID=UPI003D6D3164